VDLLNRLVQLTRDAYVLYQCKSLTGLEIGRQLSNPEYIDMMDDALDCLRDRYGTQTLLTRSNELREFGLRLAAIQISVNQAKQVVALILHDLSAN
jgi:hypothetical protein